MTIRGWTWLAIVVGLIGFWAFVAIGLLSVGQELQGIGERIAAVIP